MLARSLTSSASSAQPCVMRLWAASSPGASALEPVSILLLERLPATAVLRPEPAHFRHFTQPPFSCARRCPKAINSPEYPLHDHRAFSVAIPSSDNAPAEGSNGGQVLSRWESLLDQETGAGYDDSDLRELFSAAVSSSGRPGAKQQNAGGVLPQRAFAVFVRVYSEMVLHADRPRFFHLLTEELGVQRSNVDAAVASWALLTARNEAGESAGSTAILRGAKLLQEACQPAYELLFRRIGQQPQGIHFLVQMRADLMEVIAGDPATAAPLRAMSEGLRSLLGDWFSVGITRLERISWEHSSAAMLEKVVAGEAVHSIRGWRDLRRRLGPSKRLFAFFHPSMPEEPLVLLHTSLQNSIATKMSDVLLPSEENSATSSVHRSEGRSCDNQTQDATTAVFYSISNTQPGLKGVELGNFLIKQAAQQLQSEIPSIHTLVTLSPIPGFRKWLEEQMHRELHDHAMVCMQGCARCAQWGCSDFVRPLRLGGCFDLLPSL